MSAPSATARMERGDVRLVPELASMLPIPTTPTARRSRRVRIPQFEAHRTAALHNVHLQGGHCLCKRHSSSRRRPNPSRCPLPPRNLWGLLRQWEVLDQFLGHAEGIHCPVELRSPPSLFPRAVHRLTHQGISSRRWLHSRHPNLNDI